MWPPSFKYIAMMLGHSPVHVKVFSKSCWEKDIAHMCFCREEDPGVLFWSACQESTIGELAEALF